MKQTGGPGSYELIAAIFGSEGRLSYNVGGAKYSTDRGPGEVQAVELSNVWDGVSNPV